MSKARVISTAMFALLVAAPHDSRAETCELLMDPGRSCILQTANPDRYILVLDGPISEALAKEAQSVIGAGGKFIALEVWDAPGGDVHAAMTLGRLVREHQIHATVHRTCASACVLTLAGAVSRTYYSKLPIGLHRPYFTSPGDTLKATAERVNQNNDAIRRYLVEMNVSPALLDAMVAIPSEQTRWISAATARDLGMLDVDPVSEEFRDANHASRLGITREAYFGRKLRFQRECSPLDYWSREFCDCIDRIGFRAPGEEWACDLEAH